MSTTNWFNISKNIEPELKIFKENKNTFVNQPPETNGLSAFAKPGSDSNTIIKEFGSNFKTTNFGTNFKPISTNNFGSRFNPAINNNFGTRSNNNFGTNFGERSNNNFGTNFGARSNTNFGTNFGARGNSDFGASFTPWSKKGFETNINYPNKEDKEPRNITDKEQTQKKDFDAIVSKEHPKKITNALLKLDKVNNTINTFMEDFLRESGIENNNEYLDLWKSSENQDKLCLYIKQKKIKMKETIEERNAKKLEKKVKRETKLKGIHQKKMDKQESKPKTAFYYFKEDETLKLKLEHPTWNRKEVHAELQKKWKDIKTTEEARPYREKTKINENVTA